MIYQIEAHAVAEARRLSDVTHDTFNVYRVMIGGRDCWQVMFGQCQNINPPAPVHTFRHGHRI